MGRHNEAHSSTHALLVDAGWYPNVNKDPRPVMMAVRLALVVGTAHGAMGAMDGVCPVVGTAGGPVRATPNQLADPASISFHTRWHADHFLSGATGLCARGPTWQFELAALPETPGVSDLLQTPAELRSAPSTAGSVVSAAGDAPASPMNTTDNTPALALSGSNIGDDGAGALPQTLALPHTPAELHAAPSAVGGAVNTAGDCWACQASLMNTPGDSPTLALSDHPVPFFSGKSNSMWEATF